MRSRKSSEVLASANFVNKPKTRTSPNTDPDPIPGNGSDVESSSSRLPKREVDFAELEDGTLVEMIEDPNSPANSLFAVYKNGTVHIASTVQCENRILVPVPREHGIFKHVLLPRGIMPFKSILSLLPEIAVFILDCVDMSPDNVLLGAAYVMSTWFVESMAVAPYLALVGLPRSGKTTLLQVLNLVCRRPLLTADISSAAFYEAYEKLNPTLLVDETVTAGNRRALFHLLKTGTTRGSVALRRGRSFTAFGPKVVSWTELPNDAALNSRCIIIPMHETNRRDLAKPTDKKILDAADVLRMQLLKCRLENYKSLRLPKVEGDERLFSRTRDLYQALALPIGSDPATCRFLVHLFETQQEINREPLSPASAAVLRFLYPYIHSHPKDGKYANKDLTIGVNLNLECLQENFRLNAHEVGRALTSLGFTNRKRTNSGFVLWLDMETRNLIHKLAHHYGIDQDSQFQQEGFGKDCELCKNLGKSILASAETKGVSGTESK